MEFLIFILLLVFFLLFKAAFQVMCCLLLLFISVFVVRAFFKDEEGVDRSKPRTIATGLTIFIFGFIICLMSLGSYRELISNTLVIGGPRPGGVLLCVVGGLITIFGIV